MTNPLYVFDMDETLINADCAMLWHEFLVEQGIVTTSDFLEQDKALMALYAKGEMDMQDYLNFSIAPLSQLNITQVADLADQCVEEKILPKLFPQAKMLIEALHQQKVTMLIISASVSFLVTAVAKRIGIQHAIGIDLVERNCGYTPNILGTPSYQEGKVVRLQQWNNNQSESFSEIHFYTDSINDLALCEHADFAYLVNPCERLVKQAQGTPWQILSWG
ncbi:HAD family hydrolase [Vibrio rumoiensis]|uniref:HAD family hydrolase n=1 Tax=Vibrio rumoiensis 1S-45 TaxID=1188252 RepID=A0A1E5E4R7_9VIBR|nr:HAD family hydrolase [Vibrio rumoiensis]OEF28108.1 HAD family hydrolase [Vibrio rumoiensis 1S-45]